MKGIFGGNSIFEVRFIEGVIMSIIVYSRIILEQRPDSVVVTCSRCNGTGENNREYTWHVCNGTGKVLLRLFGRNPGVIKCERCDGSGENNREYFCRVCKGVGALVKPLPRISCSKCSSTGENNREYFCSVCDACGSVYPGNVPEY